MDQRTAYQHHQAGRYADAARGYELLLARNPHDATVLHLFGVLHQESGYSDRAVELISQAIVLLPDVAAFHANLAEAYRSLKKYELAASSCRSALHLQPDFPEAAANLGLILHDQGLDAEAIELFDAALAMRPDFANAHNCRGTSLRAVGRPDEAVAAFREAVRLDPHFGLARANLGQLLVDLGKPAEGLFHCEEAVRIQPHLPAAYNNLGNALRALERWDESRAAYAETIRLEPGLAVAYANLGQVLQLDGKIHEALPHFRRAVELAPDDRASLQKLAAALALNEDWEAVIPVCEQRVRLEPANADAYCELGWAYLSVELPVQADAALRRALELKPEHLEARLNLGLLQEEQGLLADAELTYRQAESLLPDSPVPLARRAVLARQRLPDADRDRLRFHLYEPLSPLIRMSCLFALAQVADARGDFAEAAACLTPANSLAHQERRRLGLYYDLDEHSRYVDRLIAGFTPAIFSKLQGVGDASRQPVFVFGMPRSGTTLVEQVLAGHSQIHGAGELTLVRRALDSLPPASQRPEDFEANLLALDAAGVRHFADVYRTGVQNLLARQKRDQEPSRVVDKMPDNYLYLGLIALMFPQATLIHVRRDLRDVAVSCWMNQFRSIRWADAQEDLTRRCLEYQRVMEHWRKVIPRTIHEIRYEDLINDFEPESRRLVAACGMEWEPGCLQFHQTSRTVRTASVTQVRQPLYRKSLARWKAYEPYLRSLLESLGVSPQ